MRAKLLLTAVAMLGGASLLGTAAQAAGSDTFNRAKLGSDWVSTAGKLSISSDALVGTTLSLGAFTPSKKDSAASAVMFLGSTDTEYGAIALGHIAGGSNAFVKLQQQDGGGTFDHAGFYTGNNVGGAFFTLSSPVPSPAVVDVFFCGTVATMRITSSTGVQTYTNDYGQTYGNGAGAGTFGSIAMDNFVGFKSACGDIPKGRSVREMVRAVDKSITR